MASFIPDPRITRNEEGPMMKCLQRSLALVALLTGSSIAAFAQNSTYVIPMAGNEATDADQVSYQTMCTGEDWVVFNGVSQKNGKIVSVCMMEGDHTMPGHLTYRYGTPGKAELVYPANAERSAEKFTIRRYTRPQVTYLKFEFDNGGFNYEIHDGGEGDEIYTELRVVRLSDGKTVAEHPLKLDTKHLSLMALEGLVPSAPFDE